MRRKLTLIGSILGLIGAVLATMWNLLDLIQWVQISFYRPGMEGMIAFSVILLSVSVTAIVFSALSLILWNKDSSVYKHKKRVIITAAVFNLVVGGTSFVFAIVTFISGFFINLIAAGGAITGGILTLVDLGKEKNRCACCDANVDVDKEIAVEEYDPEKEEKTSKAIEAVEQKTKAADELLQNLSKIDSLKEKGMLTEEEYKTIKKAYINKFLKQ